MRRALTTWLLLAIPAAGGAFELQLEGWRASIEPSTLEVRATLAGEREAVRVAEAIARPYEISALEVSTTRATWRLAEPGIAVTFAADGPRLVARFEAGGDAQLAWPTTDDARFTALIYPEGEGLYVPFDDAVWRRCLAGHCAGLSGGMSMPFWSYRFDSAKGETRTLTLAARHELRAELCLEEHANRLTAALKRQFHPRDGNAPLEIEIWFGGGSPISPALEFRDRLRAAGSFKTLAQKIRDNPQIGRLAGATHMYVWGDGRKPEFIADLVKAGVRRAWVGYDQDEFTGQILAGREFVEAAKAAGFLVGPYDTFNNAQDPTSGDAVSRWPGKLYPEGCIVNRDGKRRAGFAGRGCELSAEALARAEATLKPLETRVTNMLRDGANSYFLDVDAFGELHDDYSPAHPMTVYQDQKHRLARLQYLRDRKVVLGSEDGVAWSLPWIDFAHGAFATRNGILWRERKSFGKWWPPDRPGIFFNAVEPSAEFRASKFDAAFRLPLYETVFHDAVVATDRWDVPMGQFPSQAKTRQLLELLYGVPSIWAMDRKMLREWRATITPLVEFFQPLHERIATLPLTSFEWLTPDRRVQRTRFGEEVRLTANFGAAPHEGLPAGCIEAAWRGGETHRFCPK